MDISKVKTAFKVADVVLDREHKVRRIKFVFLDRLFDEHGKPISTDALKDNAGRIYIFTSNGIIQKIGGSQCKGGIKATMSFYQGGMQGGPSIRTFGIHILIKEELEKGKNVEVYMITSQKTTMKIKGLFKEEDGEVSSFKEMEDKCKNDYKSIEKDYPPWNYQEAGRVWRQDILKALNEHDAKRKSLTSRKEDNK